MKKILLYTAVMMSFGALLTSCGGGAGEQKSKSGLVYEIKGPGTGKAPNDSSAVEIHYSERTDKDSVLSDSKNPKFNPSGKAPLISLGMPNVPPYIKEAIKLMKEGDSATFKYPSDSVFKGPLEAQRPPFIKKGSFTKFKISLLKVYTNAEYTAKKEDERKKMVAENTMRREQTVQQMLASNSPDIKKNQEEVEKYIKSKKLKAEKTASGLYIVMETPGTGDNVMPGNKVKVNYTGRLLDGKLFDTSDPEIAKKENKYQEGRPYGPFEVPVGEGRVIMGWEEGLTKFNKGAKGKLIIPAYLGYGSQGAGAMIPANAGLEFDIEIVDIAK